MGEAPSKVEQPEERLVPGTWGDLFLYLFGGGGAFLAAGLGVSLLFEEINFGLTMAALLLNVVFLGGSVYLLGIRRGKISWKSLGLFPPVWEARYIGWAFLLIVTLFPVRVCAGFLAERFLSGNLESLELRRQLLYVDNLPKFLALLIGGGNPGSDFGGVVLPGSVVQLAAPAVWVNGQRTGEFDSIRVGAF